MSGMGFVNGLAPATPPCDHRGHLELHTLGDGMGLRFCGNCGETYALIQEASGAFLLVKVPEHGEDKWAEIEFREDEQGSDEDRKEDADAEQGCGCDARPVGLSIL